MQRTLGLSIAEVEDLFREAGREGRRLAACG